MKKETTIEKEIGETVKLDPRIYPGFATRDEAVAYLRGNDELWQKFEQLPEEFQKEMIGYCVGENGLLITRDYIFKKIFNPTAHAKRLESLLSALMGATVKIVRELPLSGLPMAEKGSFVVMDVLTEMEGLGYADLEMQKIGYKFPLQRSDCYGADIIMRQYNRIRSQMKEEQKEDQPFDFRMLKPVFCIVLAEKSWPEFRGWPEFYVHRRYMTFDTGVMQYEKGLREDIYVCLDLFRKRNVSIDGNMKKLDAWLTFLSETDAGRILELLEAFPEFRDAYGEIADLVRKPEELMEMYSDVLRMMDRNTERNMVTDLQTEVEELQGKIEEKEKVLEEKKKVLAEKNKVLEEKEKTIEEKKKTIEEKEKTIEEKEKTIEEKEKTIEEKEKTIEEKNNTIEDLKKELEQLRGKMGGE